jgi:hypothetical protein
VSNAMNGEPGQMVQERVQFQWLNCYGDVIAHRFDRVILDYWN